MSTRWSSQWQAYRDLLAAALDGGYRAVGLDEWVHAPPDQDGPCLILRHDVDQQPASALRMAKIERDLGLRGTWYFRWRTAHPLVVAQIADLGGAIGLHYETLSRVALSEGLREADESLIAYSRKTLCREVAAFRARFGPIRSICPHGDTRVPGIDNHVLLRGEDPAAFGVTFDGNEVMRGHRLGGWVTDRRGGTMWKDSTDPRALFAAGATPIFAVIHANNWTSRLHAGTDRALRAALPDTRRLPRPIRSGSDSPPV